MKIFFLLIFLTLVKVAYSIHKRRHRNRASKEQLWRRHYINKKKHEIKGQNPEKEKFSHDRDINVTKIYDHVSKYHQARAETQNGSKRSSYVKGTPGIWKFDTIGSDDVKVLVSDVSKKTDDIVNGVRRSDCISGNDCMNSMIGGMGMNEGMMGEGMNHHHGHYNQFSHELFVPGGEKTFSEPMSILDRHDHGTYHHYENGGHPVIGGLAHGSAIVTHQMDYQSTPNNVFMHGIEKTQPGIINGGFLQPSSISLTMPDVHIHKKPVHIIKPHFRTSYVHKDERVRMSNPCMNGGLHFNLGHTQQCICQQAYMGKLCQEKNYCYPNPCLHEGHCQNTKENPYYKCACRRGFFGEMCDNNDPCYPNPCRNLGICTHDNQNATCICHNRYRGGRCELLSSCQPNPCMNNGLCAELEGDGRFICECDNKWKGTTCEKQSFCRANPCMNGGSCREADDHFVCTCSNGYHGPTCSDRICLPNPCSNGGTCVEDGETFRCVCHPWNTGDICDVNRPCLVKPCLHDGTCIDAYSGYHWSFGNLQYYCLCKSPYKGMNCEIHPCKNCHQNAHCDVDHCVCDEGYEGNGESCSKLRDPCHPNPCFNEGICIPDADNCPGLNSCGFRCDCNPPYRPPICKEKNPCEPNPCVNGACGFQQGSDETFSCSCDDGYKGRLCNVRDACKPNPCQHAGTCTSANGTATCICLGHWKAPLCKDCSCPLSTTPGIPGMTCTSGGSCSCPDNYIVNLQKGVCEKEGGSSTARDKYCDINKPCLNGGLCIDIIPFKFRCSCDPTYYGQTCQYRAVCFSQPCKNGGTCNERDGKFLGCRCTPGFAPPYCSRDYNGGTGGTGGTGGGGGGGPNPIIGADTGGGPNPTNQNGNPCSSGPCMNKGVCLANRGSYDCLCSLQFTGPHCEVDRCLNCHPKASCVAGSCQCNKGFVGNGHNCEKEICEQVCIEWSTCVDGNCVCDPGYQMARHKCIPDEQVALQQPSK